MITLLHPTDFSANSEQAFQIACSIARDRDGLLTVLHVVSPHECAPHDLCGTELNPASDLYHCVWNHFDQLRSLAGTVKVSFEVRIGETLESILEVVTREHCDLIVLTGRNHVGSHYQQHGCISECLVRKAPCSVLLLRHFHADQYQTPTAIENDVAGHESHPHRCDAEGGVIGAHW